MTYTKEDITLLIDRAFNRTSLILKDKLDFGVINFRENILDGLEFMEHFKGKNQSKPDILDDEISLHIGDGRVFNALKDSNINLMRDLVSKPEMELIRIPNMGSASIRYIRSILAPFNLSLGIKV